MGILLSVPGKQELPSILLFAQGKSEFSESSHNFPEATLLLTLTLSQDLTSQSQSCWLPGSTASGPQNALRIVCAKEVSAGSCQPVPPDTCCESVAAGFWRWRSPKK